MLQLPVILVLHHLDTIARTFRATAAAGTALMTTATTTGGLFTLCVGSVIHPLGRVGLMVLLLRMRRVLLP